MSDPVDLLSDFRRTVRWAFAEAQLGDRRENAELLARVRGLE